MKPDRGQVHPRLGIIRNLHPQKASSHRLQPEYIFNNCVEEFRLAPSLSTEEI